MLPPPSMLADASLLAPAPSPHATSYLFATALAVGCATPLLLLPVRGLGRRFFVLSTLLALILYALAIVREGLGTGPFHLACAGLLVVYNVTLRREGSAFSRAVLLAAVLAGNTGLAADALLQAERLPALGAAAGPLASAQALASSAVLGTSLVSMILGHFYLVARGLSFDILRRSVAALLAALAVRAALLALAGAAQWERMAEMWGVLGPARFGTSHGLFLGVVLLFGLAAPAVLGWMALHCARERSNQSATGILYVVLAFVLIGEITSKHFLVTSGLLV